MQRDLQRARALACANEKRIGRKRLRDEVLAGRVDVRDLLKNPPEILVGMKVIEVLMLTRVKAYSGFQMTESNLGRQAARDGINLLLPVDRASLRTRLWAVEHCPTVRARGVDRAAA